MGSITPVYHHCIDQGAEVLNDGYYLGPELGSERILNYVPDNDRLVERDFRGYKSDTLSSYERIRGGPMEH